MELEASLCGDSSGAAAAGVDCEGEGEGEYNREVPGGVGGTDLLWGYYGDGVLLWYGDDTVVVLGVDLVRFHGHAKLCIPLARVLGSTRGMGRQVRRTLTMVTVTVTVSSGTRP